jgi:hypothetical protein
LTCICDKIPSNRRAEVWSPGMISRLVHVFHQDCEEHGVVLSPVLPGKAVDYKEWINQAQFRAILQHGIPFRVVEKAKDGLTALVEWSIWVTMEEEVVSV